MIEEIKDPKDLTMMEEDYISFRPIAEKLNEIIRAVNEITKEKE